MRDEEVGAVSGGGAVSNEIRATGSLAIDVLGPLVVRRGRVPVEVGPAMVRNLLALLALPPGRVVPRDEIVAALWAGSPPATYVNLIHVYVSRLRAQLRDERQAGADADSLISAVHGGYRLALPAESVDLTRFHHLLRGARQVAENGDVLAAVDMYDDALSIWRGPVLADAPLSLAQLPVALAANRQRIDAAAEQARLYGSIGRHRAAVDVLQDFVRSAPLHEGLHAQLMSELAGAGDRASAMTVYAEIRGRLSEELGVDPGRELQASYMALLRDGEAEHQQRAVGVHPDDVRVQTGATRKPDAPNSADPPQADPTSVGGAGSAVASARRPPSRPRVAQILSIRTRRPRLVASVVAVVMLLVVCGYWVLGTSLQRPRKVAAAQAHDFSTTIRWQWDYGASLGSTPTNEQWASAKVSGLGQYGCAGFRFRVGNSPDGDENNRGLLLAVCGPHWEIEAQEVDFVHGDADLPPDGLLMASISADDVVTITFNGKQLASRRLHGNYTGGRHIAPAIWQGDGNVALSAIRSGVVEERS